VRGIVLYFLLLTLIYDSYEFSLLAFSFVFFFSIAVPIHVASHRIASHQLLILYSIITGLELLALILAARTLTDKGRGAYQNKNRTKHDGVGLSKRKEKERKGGEKTNQKSSSRKRIINNCSQNEWRGKGVKGE